MPPDVEGVPLVLLHPDALQELGPEVGEHAGLAEEVETDRGDARLREELAQLVLDAFR